jgi:hypothetical protein
VIETFGDKETEKLWQGQRTRFPADLLHRAISKHSKEIVQDNTVSESTTNGASASAGIPETHSK